MTTKAELDSKHLAELHELAADAGVERYRMLSRAELIEKLAGGDAGGDGAPRPKRERSPRRRKPREDSRPRGEREPRRGGSAVEPQAEPEPEAAAESRSEPEAATARVETAPPGPKRRRRRRWGRRRKGVRLNDLLLPAAPGRQAIVYAEGRDGCTALLREVAAELSEASGGPDPIALLVDPGPEELADWKREAPQAEIVSAGKAKHAEDALAQARIRAEAGEDVIVLIDSLTRFTESFGDVDDARALLDSGSDSLTIVAALERSG